MVMRTLYPGPHPSMTIRRPTQVLQLRDRARPYALPSHREYPPFLGNRIFLDRMSQVYEGCGIMRAGECLVMTAKGPDRAQHDAAGAPRSDAPIRIELAELLGGRREAIIVHNGADYRLRVTANGKLILTK